MVIKLKRFSAKEEGKKHIVSDGLGLTSGALALGAVGIGVASKLAKKLEKRDKSEK